MRAVYILIKHEISSHQHDIELFACGQKVIHKMIGMSNEQVLEHFKEAFPPWVKAHLLETDGIDIEIGREFSYCYLGQNCQSTSSMLAHMTMGNAQDRLAK